MPFFSTVIWKTLGCPLKGPTQTVDTVVRPARSVCRHQRGSWPVSLENTNSCFLFQSTLIINCILFVTQTLLQCLEVLKSSNSTQRLAALSISNRTGQVYLFASRTALPEFLLKLQTYMPVNTMKFVSCEQHKCLENTYATTRPPTNGRPCSLECPWDLLNFGN